VVPVGQSSERLPIGVQLAGRPWEEELVLAVASAIEEDFGYKPPPIG
jgi:Asp-tRNA(Asn)/Glu-tRNA(Gln) amidotransferase A subunit family amidase